MFELTNLDGNRVVGEQRDESIRGLMENNWLAESHQGISHQEDNAVVAVDQHQNAVLKFLYFFYKFLTHYLEECYRKATFANYF